MFCTLLVGAKLLRKRDMPPFDTFARSILPQTPLREAITAACRRPEPECLPPLLELASLPPAQIMRARTLATRLVGALRAKTPAGGVEGLIPQNPPSTHHGAALISLP